MNCCKFETMKTFTHISRFFLLLLMVAGFSAMTMAQGPEAKMKKVVSAISSSDASALAGHFNSTVEVTVPGEDNSFSDQQATFVMKNFFAKYPVKSVELMHQGNSGATYYATASTATAKGNFDTNIFLKKIGDSFKVTVIRFEAE